MKRRRTDKSSTPGVSLGVWFPDAGDSAEVLWAAKYVGLSASSFVRQAALKEARAVLRQAAADGEKVPA